MALYLNVGNESFQESLNSLIYVDKSPLIEILNKSIKTKNKYCNYSERSNTEK